MLGWEIYCGNYVFFLHLTLIFRPKNKDTKKPFLDEINRIYAIILIGSMSSASSVAMV